MQFAGPCKNTAQEEPVCPNNDMLLLKVDRGLYAIPDKTTESIASKIYMAYCQHSFPNNIFTDLGREFVNEVYIAVTVCGHV